MSQCSIKCHTSQLEVIVDNIIKTSKLGGKLMETTTRYLTEGQVSEITNFALSTLRNARFNRTGIPYHKIGRRSVRYKLSDVIGYMDSHRIETAGSITAEMEK